eukprot:m.94017 g.94017  ORF g.94017 m.94017 type:complete len:53 (-) comp15001_c0_seq2:1989-2147(-)
MISGKLGTMLVGLATGGALGVYVAQTMDVPRVKTVIEELTERVQSEADKRAK